MDIFIFTIAAFLIVGGLAVAFEDARRKRVAQRRQLAHARARASNHPAGRDLR